MRYVLAAVLVVALANCGAGGILTMDDQWCAKHPAAPPSRCGGKPDVWYRPVKATPQMMNGPAVRELDPAVVVIPDPDE